MRKRDSTADEVYDWAVKQELPAPDAFAMRYWDLAGATIRLGLAAALWRRQVKNGTTGFPLVDGDRTDS